jgi:hypothetical protein
MGIAIALLVSSRIFSQDVPIEMSQPQKGGQGLGTAAYQETAKEAPFEKKITEKPVAFWTDIKLPKPENMTDEEWAKMKKEMEKEREKAKETTISDEKYQLKDQAGKYVGWFGIVRSSSWDPQAKTTTLRLEHKYFDGMVDLHQQIVSLYGAGDFQVTVKKEKTGIPPLSLVRVYGKVTLDKEKRPVVAAEYIRVWDWGLFAFMDYGKDKTDPQWVKLRKVPGEEAYDSRPTKEYYEERLGKRDLPAPPK